MGRAAHGLTANARENVASLIGASSADILFTSCATESINLAIRGAALVSKERSGLASRRNIVTTNIEHKAVLETIRSLARSGWGTKLLPVQTSGRLDLDHLEGALGDDVFMLSAQAANQELSTLQQVGQLAALARRHGALFHCDASQAVGKIPVSVDDWDVDLLSFSGHKMYGPKGVGVLYVRDGVAGSALEPVIYGGGQEHGLRSGTLNVPAIVGLGEACKIASEVVETEGARLRSYRDRLESLLAREIPVQVNGDIDNRLPGATSLTFRGADAEALIFQAPELALSTGSACTSGAPEPSHVLTAIGLSREDAWSTIRLSFGRPSVEEDVEIAADALIRAYRTVVQ